MYIYKTSMEGTYDITKKIYLFLRDYWTKLDWGFAEMQIISYIFRLLKHIQVNLKILKFLMLKFGSCSVTIPIAVFLKSKPVNIRHFITSPARPLNNVIKTRHRMRICWLIITIKGIPHVLRFIGLAWAWAVSRRYVKSCSFLRSLKCMTHYKL